MRQSAMRVVASTALTPVETVVIDGLMCAGIVSGSTLDELSTRELQRLARGAIQAACADLDADALVAQARRG